jgi:hypothetical protein
MTVLRVRFIEHNLKKQTQFMKGQHDVKSILTMGYGNIGGSVRRKNKANLFRTEYCVMRIAKRNLKKQSQFFER